MTLYLLLGGFYQETCPREKALQSGSKKQAVWLLVSLKTEDNEMLLYT